MNNEQREYLALVYSGASVYAFGAGILGAWGFVVHNEFAIGLAAFFASFVLLLLRLGWKASLLIPE